MRQPSGFKEGDEGMEVNRGEKGEVEVIKELTTENAADIGTKPLDRAQAMRELA